MTTNNKEKRMKKRVAIHRRRFIKSVCAGVGLAAASSQLSIMSKMGSVAAQSGPGYKALVCVFMSGGNDSNNLLIPTAGQLRDQYLDARGPLALTNGLHELTTLDAGESFGVHPECSGIASLFNAGNLAFLANVGTLAYPITNRQDYLSRGTPRPLGLFSHTDQQLQWQSGIADQRRRVGWGGKLAARYSSSTGFPVMMSLNGNATYLVTDDAPQYVLNPSGAATLSGFGANYGNALNPDGSYLPSNQGRRLRMLDRIAAFAQTDGSDAFASDHASVFGRARDTESTVNGVLTEAASEEAAGGFSFDALFTNAGADTPLGNQLKMVARLIAGRAASGNRRQVFFVRIGGFDTHNAQLVPHAAGMAEVSGALRGFWDSLTAMGAEDSVTTFTASDFNRTLTPNRQDITAGADHAWGGHAMVMGGAVAGQKIYGAFPSLVVGAEMDVTHRGRFFPTTSVEQYGAVLADWFGVDVGGLEALFPNLSRFDSPFDPSANLQLFG